MRAEVRGAFRCLCGLLLTLAGACNERPRPAGRAERLPESLLPSARARLSAAPREPRAPDASPSEPAVSLSSTPPAPSAIELAPAADAQPALRGPFILDELVDVAPAGPAAAHDLGVVLVSKADTLIVARRGALSRSRGSATTPVAALDRARTDFAPYARGPAIAGRYAHWISHGKLVRRSLDGSGELETLAPDARQGTRVAAASRGVSTLVAYVARAPAADEPPRARLWVEGSRYELTPDGSGASAVALAPQGDGFILLALDGRSGMTPLHARRIRVGAKRGEVILGPDQVVWVGGGAQATTEVAATTAGNEVWAFLAIERDVTHFGLAQIHVGREPRVDVPALWVPYPNGINTSPVAAVRLCDRHAVVFARPSTAAPFAPQELVLAELGSEGLVAGEVVVRAKAFADVSLASVEGGALLAYTADHRTWAASLRCRKP